MSLPVSPQLPGLPAPLLPCSLAPVLMMTAPTHVVFGILTASLFGLLVGIPLTPTAFACVALGALLPDVDTTTSTLGRLLYPVAAFIERRFGHRSITHSLAGLTIAALLAYSPWLIADHLPSASRYQLPATSYVAFVIGYASHLVADSMTKSGIPLFWPNVNVQAVLPGNEAYRVRVGSPAEYIFLAILFPLTAVTVPLNQLSLTTTLHYVIRNVNSAASDYQAWAGQYQVWVELEGRHNLSQKPVDGVFEAIGTAGQNAIIIRDRQGDIYAAGQSRNDDIYVHRIRAIRGHTIRTDIHEVRLADQLLGDLLSQLSRGAEEQGCRGELNSPPHLRTSAPLPLCTIWLQGWFVTPQRPILIDDVGEFNRSKRAQSVAGEHLYEIRYFTPEDLAPLRDIYVTRAHFIVRTVYPVDGPR